MGGPGKTIVQNETQSDMMSMLSTHDELLDVYRHMLKVAFRKMKNEADALDIVQESWIKILNKWDTLRDKNKLIHWAKTIVINTANSAIRRKIVYQEILREHADFIYTSCFHSQNASFQIEKYELLSCMKLLDEGTRRILLLKFYYGWKDQEIADQFQMPVGTIKARIHRGKKQLRDWLQDDSL